MLLLQLVQAYNVSRVSTMDVYVLLLHTPIEPFHSWTSTATATATGTGTGPTFLKP